MNQKNSNNTYNKIIENAIILFNEKGYDGTSISDIAGASSVSKGILYHYFKNKDALYLYCVKNFVETAYAHISEQKLTDNDIDSLVMQIINFGGFFEKYPHYEYIFLNMLNEKPNHLSAELHNYCLDFKEKNRSHFTKLIGSIDLGKGVTKCDVENFLFIMQNSAQQTISSLISENQDESSLKIMARMIKIYLQGLKSDLT